MAATQFMDHWVNIDAKRLARYETMYQWSATAADFYAPADIRAGHAVVDFGCGPGHAAIEFARRVGPAGHVHAFDINAEFVRRTQQKADPVASMQPVQNNSLSLIANEVRERLKAVIETL